MLFLVPGLAWLALLGERDRSALSKDEAAFLAVALSVAASSWVALALAEVHRFALVTAASVIAVGCAAVLVVARRRARLPWSGLGPAKYAWGTAAVLALSLVLFARPGEYLLGGRDPGIYVAAMATIARHGGIDYVDPVVRSVPPEDVELFFRNPARPDYSWGRFMGFPLERPETGRVVPEFFHLFPAFGAYLFQAMGVRGALATPPIFGVLGTVAALLAFRRLFGPAAGLLAALLLAVNVLQAWFARYPVSETMSQFLVLAALFAFALFEDERSAAFAWTAGALLGLALLVRIDGVLLALPLFGWIAIRRAQHALPPRQAAALLVPFALLGAHAALHASVFSRKYLLEIASRPYWRQPPLAWLAAAAIVVACVLTAHHYGPVVRRRLEGRSRGLRAAIAGAAAALAAYAYLLRPMLSAWAGADGNDPALKLAHTSTLAALGFRALAAHDAQSLVRLGWFVTPLALALALLGLVLALRDWRPRYLFPLLTLAAFALFYLYKIRVYADYFFAMRRFVPVVVPMALALAAFALARLGRRAGWRRTLAGGLAAALLAAFLRDTLPTVRSNGGWYREWPGAVRFVDDVARRFGPQDVVIFEQPRSIHLLSLPLWAVHGVNALELARFNPDPDRLQHLVRAWRGAYRNIYFVHTYSTDLCGLFLERVEEHSFGSFEFERAYGHPPRGPEFKSLRFTISRVVLPEELQVPALPEVDVGGSDDVQVSGFHDKEGGADHTYRWSGSCASIYLPAAGPGSTVVVTASAGRRPPSKPAVVRARLGATPIGTFTASPDWRDFRLAVPGDADVATPVLRLDVEGWRPANTERGSDDVRDLGVMVDRVRVERAGGLQ